MNSVEFMIFNLINVIFVNLISALGGDLPGMSNKKIKTNDKILQIQQIFYKEKKYIYLFLG